MEIQLSLNDAKKVSEICEILEKERYFLLTTHRNIDGDAIGSEIALYSALKRAGKEAIIVNYDSIPAIYRFLPYTKRVHIYSSEISITPDVAIVIDCGSSDRTGNVFKLVKKAKIVVNIDHHFSNPGFAHLNWTNHNFSATGEMVYFLISYLNRDISRKEAECLYTAILTDTGSFIYNIKPFTMGVVQDLINRGAAPEKIAKKVYLERPLRSIKLLYLALGNLKFERERKTCWMKISRDMYRKTRTKEEDTEGFIDLLVKIKEANIVFLIKEAHNNVVKVSLRSKGRFDVECLASKFGGGGHKKAAGCYFTGLSLDEVEQKVLNEIDKMFQKGRM
ncbi:MAG: DHH family phosphoesterase [Candidatus Omnitrophica bacterium]|nr:DHH family phosphoesterase [Candidatus Omnitrophota bacterium]MCM8777020.1 DHH family phosphoesterase [Candidatus Omnitrophota bacterium]